MQYSTIQELINERLSVLSKEHVLIQQHEKRITVGEVQEQSGFVLNWIVHKKLSKGTPIALLMNDKIEIITSIIGILKAACIFVPLETNYPADTIKDMLQIAKVKIVLTDDYYEKYDMIFNYLNIDIINVKTLLSKKPSDHSDETKLSIQKLYGPEDAIYIYFTSGTTNKPKAILGRNKGLTHFVEWESEKVGNFKANISQLTTPCHDPFLRDIFVAINLGGTICIPYSRDIVWDGCKLLNWIRNSKVNIMHCTPGLFNHMLMTMDKPREFPDLQYIFLAGDKINPRNIKKWFQMAVGKFQLKNLYGPTETTLAKLCYDISPEDGELLNIPIGKPIDGAEVYIFNEKMYKCDINEIGEIYIRTPYRSLGYIDQEDLTRKVFIPFPLSDNKDDIIYKTGDLGRILEDGNIEFIGRMDNQIKIRGNRVELGYIEQIILKMDDIIECVVVFSGNNDDEYITAYIVSRIHYTRSQVINFLKEKIPDYMLPTYIVFLDVLPLNNNMKINKKALPDPHCIQEEVVVHPHNEIEKKLVQIYKEILNIKNINITENFFTLGGTSLNVMSLLSQLYIEFQTEISLEDIFSSSSLEELAGLIMERLQPEESKTDKLEFKENYSIQKYEKKLSDNYKYIFPGIEFNKNKIEGIQPFNDVFYQSCVFNSLFSVLKYYNANILSLFTKDIILYGTINTSDIPKKTEYYELESIENTLKSIGIGFDIYEIKDCLIQKLIHSLDSQRPVIVGVDCFYESIRPEYYKKSSWPHNLLVYGYDNDRQEMTILEHTGANNLDYHEQKLSYLDLDFAFFNNLMKFHNTEKRRHYMEFYKISLSMKKDDRFYFCKYRDNVMNNLNRITHDLDNLGWIIDYLKSCNTNLDQLIKNSIQVINILDSYIEAKYNQIYMFKRFSLFDPILLKGVEYLKVIANKWKLIRNVIYRSKILNNYNRKSFENAFASIEEIYDVEMKFYNWLKNYKGGNCKC